MATAAPAAVRTERDALVAFTREYDRRRDAIASSAASLVDPERFRGIVLAAFTRTPALWECDPVTVARAVVEAAQLGLEPTGLMGGAYLVPHYNSKTRQKECTLIVGYRGLVDLARRTGEIQTIEARVVRAQDEFSYALGLEPELVHVPALDVPLEAENPMTHVYAIATWRNGAKQFDVMTAAEIEVIATRSRSRDRTGALVGPWITDALEMAKKTVLRRLAKLLPLAVEARRILDAEDAFEQGAPPVKVDGRRPQLRSRIAARIAGAAPGEGNGAGSDNDGSDGDGLGTSAVTGQDGGGHDSPAAARDSCGAESPYSDGQACVELAGHASVHRGPDRSSWGDQAPLPDDDLATT